jgi:hypothetical protein
MKRETWAPLALAGLAVVFSAVCLGLWLSRGNHWWLKRKLRIGALMLTLTGVANGCTCAETSCYAPLSDLVIIEGQYPGSELVMDLKDGNRLSGRLEHSLLGPEIPFQIMELDGDVIQADTLQADDGAFDEPDETFHLVVRGDIQPGDYYLEIYYTDHQPLDAGRMEPFADFRLEVIDSRD